jgi:hypothetical protein
MASISAFPAPTVPSDPGAVSWGAVIAGAVGAAALSLILFVLGTGLGLSAVSPWTGDGVSGTTVGVGTIVWVTVVQLLASVLGGYLAGRLRSRWISVHSNEVFFRDTAHGFLAWAVSTLLMATLLSSAVGALVSTGAKAGSAAVGTAVKTATAGIGAAAASAAKDDSAGDAGAGANPLAYYVDSLFRPRSPDAATPAPAPAPASASASAQGATSPAAGAQSSTADKVPEVTRIFARAMRDGELSRADQQYLGQLVAANTGLSQSEAEARVSETFTQTRQTVEQATLEAKQAADDARKASAWLALWLVVSLLVGAFVASLAATFGGRLRDSAALSNT